MNPSVLFKRPLFWVVVVLFVFAITGVITGIINAYSTAYGESPKSASVIARVGKQEMTVSFDERRKVRVVGLGKVNFEDGSRLIPVQFLDAPGRLEILEARFEDQFELGDEVWTRYRTTSNGLSGGLEISLVLAR